MDLSALGDQAILARFDDESKAQRWAAAIRAAKPAWLVDVVCAYFTVAVYFDVAQIRFREVEAYLAFAPADAPDSSGIPSRPFLIPCAPGDPVAAQNHRCRN